MTERLSINEAPTSTLDAPEGKYYFPAVLVKANKEVTPVKVGLESIQEKARETESRFSPSYRQFRATVIEGGNQGIRIDSTTSTTQPTALASITFQNESTLTSIGERTDASVENGVLTIMNTGTYRLRWEIGFTVSGNSNGGNRGRYAIELQTTIGMTVRSFYNGYFRPMVTNGRQPFLTMNNEIVTTIEALTTIDLKFRASNLMANGLLGANILDVRHTEAANQPETRISIERLT